ncbi:MAG: hypothetical protein KIPDCIKN_00045 [Haliscomenobacter sp.]|jgi:hypothetical protein|nr:hypothetical protein [Haliscomenobacter sp.]
MNRQFLFKALTPHLVALAILFALNALFFAPQFQGKVPRQGDIVSWEAASKEIKDYETKTGDQLLWTDAMFGGMPAYQIAMKYQGFFLGWVQKILSLGFNWPIGGFLAMMIAFYIMLAVMGVHPWLAVTGALAFGFTTNNFVLFEAGHSNKLAILIFLPLIFAGLFLMFYKKRYLLGGALFALALGGNLGANHVQMTYYFAICLLILGLFWVAESVKARSWKPFLVTAALSVAGIGLALGAVLSNLWPTYEYAKDTMRGKPILEATAQTDPSSSSTTDGLAWDYAMQWSNNWQDVMSVLVPRAAGGGTNEKVKSGATYDALAASGMQRNPDGSMQLPMYWGALPFTSGPVYFGAVIVFLFVLGLFLVKGSLKWWAGLAVLLTVLLSLGKNLEFFQRLFFDYLPIYNKFRAPSSILTITAFFPPLLGIYALSGIVKKTYDAKDVQKALAYAGGITGAVCLFFAVLGSSFFTFTTPGDSNYQAELVELLKQDRQSLLSSDAWRSFFFIAVSAGLIWGYVRKAFGPIVLIAGIGLLTFIDLWGVGRRYVGPELFVPKTGYTSQFQPRPADEQILAIEKRRGDYRVLDLAVNTFNSSMTSYYHNTIGGYSAAKLQRFQDLIDFHIVKNNSRVLDMLNTKYIITKEGQVQQNPGAIGPVWFVDSVRIVRTPNQEIDALTDFTPASEAVILDKEFGDYIGSFDPEKAGTISLQEYNPQHLTYQSNAPTEQLAVFSEIWYGPDKGWKALVDGKETPFIRANYALRAMRIPAGQHQVEFVFEPQSVKLGGLVSSVASLALLLGFIGIAGFGFWKWTKNPVLPESLPAFEPAAAPTPAKPQRPTAKTTPTTKPKPRKK